jgi:uncharacterized protein YifN (PemK superfamily)
MEDLKYEYIPLHLPNILARWEKIKPKERIEVCPDIKPLLDELAMKYPNWQFVARSYWLRGKDNVERYEATRFGIFEKRELLGEITTEWSRKHGRVYVIQNDRIANVRERGTATKTKDLAKAMKVIAKNFGKQTTFEKMVHAMDAASEIVMQVANDRYSRFSNTYSHISHRLGTYVVENLEVIGPVAVANGADEQMVANLPNLYNEHLITKEIQECHLNNTGVVVLIHGNDYVAMLPPDGNENAKLTTYSTDTLPPHLKVSLGMLKLVENKHFIKGVGVRISEDTFFISKGAEV